jgi:hypothetical protein
MVLLVYPIRCIDTSLIYPISGSPSAIQADAVHLGTPSASKGIEPRTTEVP